VGRIAIDDDLLDGQLLRVLGSAPHGGADIGECLAAVRLIDPADLDSWYEQWTALGQRVVDLADRAAAAGHAQTARLAYLRGSNYLRAGGSMLMGAPVDPRLVESNLRTADAFRKGAALLDTPPEIIEIGYEDTTLPGYFFAIDTSARPTVILVGGYDACAEELYFFNGASALERGYNVLAFDGPGQGAALLQQGLVMRPDWENVIAPVVDYVLERREVDTERIAVIGLSLGAHLAPRAASGEHRIAACIADCGTFDMYGTFLSRLPEAMRAGYEAGDPETVRGVAAMLDQIAMQPTAGWSMRRGMLVHGASSAHEYVEMTKPYSLRGLAERITCPTFVCNAENDPIGATAPDLVAALTCPHEFVTFTAAEGAGDHCEAGARLLYDARSLGWLDGVFGRR
jgi:pimeloyl-ACP methyl ester carboxylesterase